jgi:monofunctional biosynthetic peptidoglycan transglycosylase
MKAIVKKTFSLSLIITLGLVAIIAAFALWLLVQFPSDKEIRGCIITKLYQVNLCPTESTYVKISRISDYLQKAIVLTEDSSFFIHKGFDFQQIENSFKANLEKGRFARGGSTITQQLSKNLFLTKDKTLKRKIFEALITMRMEKVLSKKEILEKYLNVVQFGEGLYGVKAASEFYFNKPPSSLSIVESAFLAFLLPSPENYSKSYFQGKLTPFARKRISQIINNLFDYNRISDEEYLTARDELDHFLDGEKKPTDLDFDSIQEENVDPDLEL